MAFLEILVNHTKWNLLFGEWNALPFFQVIVGGTFGTLVKVFKLSTVRDSFFETVVLDQDFLSYQTIEALLQAFLVSIEVRLSDCLRKTLKSELHVNSQVVFVLHKVRSTGSALNIGSEQTILRRRVGKAVSSLVAGQISLGTCMTLGQS